MWFRNLRAFRLDDGWTYDASSLGVLLEQARFQPCGATDQQSHGWVPPRGIEGEMVVSVGRQQLIALGTEQKLLPGSVVRQYVAERVEALEAQQGYKPGRGQLREIRELVTAELLPRAFVRRRLTYVWIDPVGRWLGVDVASAAKADEVVEQLKVALDALPLLPLRTALSPSVAMTQWLAEGAAPAGFSIDRDCELRSQVEEKATVRYVRHSLEVDEVRPHLEAGKKATRLAMTWDDRMSFVLTEDMHIKRLAFLDVLKEQSEQQAGDGDMAALFEADLAIMAGELARFLPALMAALGGEAEA
ncbi:MAG TPA: recombination-associated protein RdgC [Rhodocyclaceae bacterium]